MTQLSKEVEERFDKVYPPMMMTDGITTVLCEQDEIGRKKIKQFLAEEIHQAKVEMLREVLPEIPKESFFMDKGYKEVHLSVIKDFRQQILDKAKELGVEEEL